MRAIVMGGTGLVGSALLRELETDSAYESVVSIARRAADSTGKITSIIVDTNSFQAPEADVAFCCLGTTIKKAGSEDAFRAVDRNLVVRYANECKASNVQAFHVVSAMGADPNAMTFYNRVKGEMEREVAAVGFRTACAYRPSILVGDRQESRPAERAGIVVAKALKPFLPQRLRAVDATIVARAMARHAKTPHPGFHAHENDELAKLAR